MTMKNATPLYKEQQEEVLRLLASINAAVTRHAQVQAGDPRDWSLVGDMSRLKETLEITRPFTLIAN